MAYINGRETLNYGFSGEVVQATVDRQELFAMLDEVMPIGEVVDPEPEPEPHTHSWSNATCTTPKTCSGCGETEGEALGHDWIPATYTAPKTCSRCGVTSGDPLTPPTDGYAISGVYTWKELPNNTENALGSGYHKENVQFTCDGVEYSSITIFPIPCNPSTINYDNDTAYEEIRSDEWTHTWLLGKTIDFGETEQTVSEIFYNWFTQNATKIS